MVKLVDQLHDGGVKLKAIPKEAVEDINPYLEEITDCFYLPEGSYVKKEIDIIINSKNYAGIRQIF